jgi:hypothetical protein
LYAWSVPSSGRWCHHVQWCHQEWCWHQAQRLIGNYLITDHHPPTPHVGASVTVVFIYDGRKLTRDCSSLQWYNIHTNFHENLFSHSRDVLCIWTDGENEPNRCSIGMQQMCFLTLKAMMYELI